MRDETEEEGVQDPGTSLWAGLADSIRLSIRRGELSPGQRLPPDAEMAAQRGVSAMTVHRAMQELQREGLVARRRRAGTFVQEQRAPSSQRVALVFSSPTNAPQSGYLQGIQRALGDEAQLLTFCTSTAGAGESARLEASALKQAAERADALICYPIGAPQNAPLLRRIARQKPVALVDRYVEGVEADVVATDNEASVLSGLRFLQGRGHSRIAYFMEEQLYEVSSVRERLAGYQKFVAGQGDPERWVQRILRTVSDGAYFARVEERLEQLVAAQSVTAVLCQQDELMAAVLEACVHLGIAVPDQLEVLSFSDIAPSLLPLARSAHRLVQRTGEMGSIAARRLQLRLESPDLPPQVVKLQADLMPASYRRPRARPAASPTAK